MKRRRLFIFLSVALVVVIAALLSTCGSKTGSMNDIVSSNIALLDQNKVSDHDLNTNDSLLRFNATVADLGTMSIGQKKDVVFKFANVSAAPIIITQIVTTCGCTSVEYKKSPIIPGEASEIRVVFDAKETGVFFKKLSIYYVEGTVPIEIAIRGKVR